MILRAATAGDAARIAALWNGFIRDTTVTFTTEEKSDAEIIAMIASRGPAFLTAEAGDGAFGFATFGPFRSGPGYAHTAEVSVFLSENARGLGMGRILVRKMEDIAKPNGIRTMIAGISGENPGATAFFERVGYEQVARMPDVGQKFGRPIDLIFCQKSL